MPTPSRKIIHKPTAKKTLLPPLMRGLSWRCHDRGREKLFVFLQIVSLPLSFASQNPPPSSEGGFFVDLPYHTKNHLSFSKPFIQSKNKNEHHTASVFLFGRGFKDLFSPAGSVGASKHLRCLEVSTGHPHPSARGFGVGYMCFQNRALSSDNIKNVIFPQILPTKLLFSNY